MGRIIRMPKLDAYRQNCCFKNRPVQIKNEDGEMFAYPCIVLYEEETDIPVYCSGFERYVCHLGKGELLNGKTLAMRAYAICHFLNYILKHTKLEFLHDCTMEIVRDFLRFMKTKEDGTEYDRDTWNRYKGFVFDFMIMYYKYNKDTLPFQFDWSELKTLTIVNDEKSRKQIKVIDNVSLHISAPKKTHKKNRVLVHDYLRLLLQEAKKYEPHVVLGIALGAYAGLREGEVVNLKCGDIKILRGGYGMLSGVEIKLLDKSIHFKNSGKKTDQGSIKNYRVQRVYNDFLSEFVELYEEHIAWMEARGLDTSKNAPLFLNRYRKPMSVQTYSDRIKTLFYERFLPTLKRACELQGTYADHAAFIDTYEDEYPGAHMFRHWFTMYLITKAKLRPGEVMKWRGDSSQESMNEYIHENADLIEAYHDSSYAFQRQLLEDVWKD